MDSLAGQGGLFDAPTAAPAQPQDDLGALFDEVLAEETRAPAPAARKKPKTERTAWADKLGVAEGDVFDFDLPGSYATGRKRIVAVDRDSVRVVGDNGAGTFLKRWEVERGLKDGKMVRAQGAEPPPASRPRTEKEAKEQRGKAAQVKDLEAREALMRELLSCLEG